MALNQQYRQRLQAIAQHEMGHHVISRVLGFRTGDVSIQVDGLLSGHRGEADIELNVPIRSVEEAQEYIRHRIMTLYAGALSETLRSSSPTKKLGEAEQRKAVEIIEDPMSGSNVDHAKIRELRAILRNFLYPNTAADGEAELLKELGDLDKDLWGQTIELVETHFELICGLATNLADRVEMVNQKATITAMELEELPAIRDLRTTSRGSPTQPQ